jgi:hypothetical protein
MIRCLTLLAVLFSFSVAQADDAPQKAKKNGDAVQELTEAEQQFEKMLSGATLVGHFTMTGKPSSELSEERYTISKVSKVPGKEDTWQFVVRIKYGQYDVNVPLDLQVKWAGDTPMITLTDLAIPALGTFSSRVLFHGDRYAGTWQHGKVGGHLFGKIEREETVDKPEESSHKTKNGEKAK